MTSLTCVVWRGDSSPVRVPQSRERAVASGRMVCVAALHHTFADSVTFLLGETGARSLPASRFPDALCRNPHHTEWDYRRAGLTTAPLTDRPVRVRK
jgi:hypothetical protein